MSKHHSLGGAKAFDFFVNKQSFTPELAAAFIGNFQQESGEALGPTVVNSIGATGITQWLGGRKNNLLAKNNPLTLETQLLFVIEELNGSEKAAYDRIKAVTGTGETYIATVTHIIRKYYERPGEAEANDPRRIEYALKAYKQFGLGIPGSSAVTQDPTTSDSAGCALPSSATSTSSGSVNTAGYSWPVEPQRKSYVNNFPGALTHMPCNGAGSCHGGRGVGTAYDLGSVEPTYKGSKLEISAGKKTYAIHKGTVEGLKIYNGIAGCYSLHIKASDGYDYWYGHIKNPTVSNGQSVTAGQIVAEIGGSNCTGNGSTAHLHIDRGRPGLIGGPENNRDGEAMVKLMNTLFGELPE